MKTDRNRIRNARPKTGGGVKTKPMHDPTAKRKPRTAPTDSAIRERLIADGILKVAA